MHIITNYAYYFQLFTLYNFFCLHLDLKPADIKHSSLRTMAKHVRRAMLPGNHEVFQKSLTEGNFVAVVVWQSSLPNYCFCPAEMDGKQVLDFYWSDPIDAMKRMVAKLQLNGKLNTTFQPGESILHPDHHHGPDVRAFDQANSGMVFLSACLVDDASSPLVALFYVDASFSGQSMSHYPIYSKLHPLL
jgi:hypothetical protein